MQNQVSEFHILEVLSKYDVELFCLGSKHVYSYILEDVPELYVLRGELMEYLEKKEAYMNAEFGIREVYSRATSDNSEVLGF